MEGATVEDLAMLQVEIDPGDPTTFCPTPGTCPPASLGILAQPHPEAFVEGSPYQGRNIFKFTSIDETTLNSFGIDETFVDGLIPGITFDTEVIAVDIAESMRNQIEGLVPRPPEDLPEPLPDWAETFDEELARIMNEVETGFFNSLTCAFEALGVPADRDELVDSVYGVVVDTAYAGIPYTGITVMLEGSFSYTGVSSFASVTAGVMMSSSGTRGVNGTINIFGIPVGYLRAFISQTDAYGNPSVSFCGEADIAIGPLELGSGGVLYDCPECEARFFEAFVNLGSVLTQSYVYETIRKILPDQANESFTPDQHLALLNTDDLKFAFLPVDNT